jgi:hypothetical protein
MSKTQIDSKQILDRTIRREDIDVETPGQSLITKVIAGRNVSISSTGADKGTGDVTINVDLNGESEDTEFFNYVYLSSTQRISSGSLVTIPFNKFKQSINPFYDTTEHIFTIPESGLYFVSFNLSFSYYLYNAYVNLKRINDNTSFKIAKQQGSYSSDLQGSLILQCSKNDTFKLQVYLEYYNRNLLKDYTFMVFKKL